MQSADQSSVKACFVLILALILVAGSAPADSNRLLPQDNNFEVMGKENPNTLVFVHGLDSSANTFAVIAGVLSQNFRVVVYDQRGHGRTIPKGLDYSPSVMAEDLETLRQYLGIERFAIYGHSLGARTALAYANRYPNRVSAFIAEDMEFFARINKKKKK